MKFGNTCSKGNILRSQCAFVIVEYQMQKLFWHGTMSVLCCIITILYKGSKYKLHKIINMCGYQLQINNNKKQTNKQPFGTHTFCHYKERKTFLKATAEVLLQYCRTTVLQNVREIITILYYYLIFHYYSITSIFHYYSVSEE